MSIYGKRKVLFETSVRGDRLVVDVFTDNRGFLSFLKNNINNGPYLVRWYKEKEDRLKEFEKYGSTSQVKSQADSYLGLLIRDNIEYFSQNKVEYQQIYNQQKDVKLNIRKEEILPKEKKNKHFLERDIKKAIAVAEILYNHFYESKEGIFGRKDMPEGLLPKSIKRGSYNHLMFITLTVSIDYQRDAPELWKVSRRTMDDPDALWIYSPKEVNKRTDGELINTMQKYRLSKKPIKDSLEIWKPVCKSFYGLFSSDPRNLLKECDYDALKVFELMKTKYKRHFPYLSGKKILPLWIRMINDVIGINLKNLDKIPIPVDIHIARATLCLGCLKGKYIGSIEDIFMEIDKVWKDACKSLPYYRLQLDEPLWHLSKYGCTNRRDNYCINSMKCPVSQYCIPGKVYVSANRVEIDT